MKYVLKSEVNIHKHNDIRLYKLSVINSQGGGDTHTYYTHERMQSDFPDKSNFRNTRCTQIAEISIS